MNLYEVNCPIDQSIIFVTISTHLLLGKYSIVLLLEIRGVLYLTEIYVIDLTGNDVEVLWDRMNGV